MPWKRGRSGMRSFVANRRPYKYIGRKRKARVGSFKRRVRAIAKGVVHRQSDLKHYDRTFLNTTLSSQSATGVFGAISLTTGPALNTTGSTRIGSKIRAHKVVVNFTLSNNVNLANSAGTTARVRAVVVEVLDQNDNGILLTGNGFFDVNSADVNVSTASNRMTAFVNQRKFRVLSDKQYILGPWVSSTTPAQFNTFVKGTYVHDFKGQEWIFNGITDAEVPNNRHVAMCWFLESESQDRTSVNERACQLDVDCRVYFTD